jgi:hypothetical protein
LISQRFREFSWWAFVVFRATKDLDMVLIVEALTPAFGRRFWKFIGAGGYENKLRSNGAPQFFLIALRVIY